MSVFSVYWKLRRNAPKLIILGIKMIFLGGAHSFSPHPTILDTNGNSASLPPYWNPKHATVVAYLESAVNPSSMLPMRSKTLLRRSAGCLSTCSCPPSVDRQSRDVRRRSCIHMDIRRTHSAVAIGSCVSCLSLAILIIVSLIAWKYRVGEKKYSTLL